MALNYTASTNSKTLCYFGQHLKKTNSFQQNFSAKLPNLIFESHEVCLLDLAKKSGERW